MAESYEREKLANAVGSLASAAPIQERLRYAFLAMHTMMAHGFTNENRQAEFDSIIERLTSKGTAPETCAQLTNAEAEAIASDIVNLNTALNWNRVYELEEQIRELKTGG